MITAWCELSRNKICGPYTIEDPETEQPQSNNTANYLEMLTRMVLEN